MTCTYSVQDGFTPRSIACSRSVWWEFASLPTISAACSADRLRTPWFVLKWYLTKKASPSAFVHW